MGDGGSKLPLLNLSRPLPQFCPSLCLYLPNTLVKSEFVRAIYGAGQATQSKPDYCKPIRIGTLAEEGDKNSWWNTKANLSKALTQ